MQDQLDWQEIILSFSDGIMVTSSDFTIRLVNPAFLQALKRGPLNLIGAKCHDAFPGKMCHTRACPLRRAKMMGKTHYYGAADHCKIQPPDPWLITTQALYRADGRFVGMLEKTMAAGALERGQLPLDHRPKDRMRKTMGAIIQAMSLTIEKRDPYTAGHQRRVAKLCRAIATALKFDWDRIQGLRMAAAIHDLGKILVPAGILNKPGPISEPEMTIIRMHPTTAHDILKGIQFPWPLPQIIYQHHERLDGSGYPRGLKADQILIEARILAVADVVESMSTFRPYRPTIGIDAAVEELRCWRGIRYDAEIVDICLALLLEEGFDFETKAWQQYRLPHSGSKSS